MRKLFASIMCCFTIAFAVCGCAPTTEYDRLEISMIQSTVTEGFAPFPRCFIRTYDFKTGRVTDTWAADTRYLAESELPEAQKDKYNTPVQIGTFTEENARTFIDEAKKLGFYTWEDRYVTTDIINDGGNETITVYFTDGTVKSTFIYFEYPPEYDAIVRAFEERLGAAPFDLDYTLL